MRKPLLALCLLALSLPLACGVDEETPPDPLATRAGFCKVWGETACQANVVENCSAQSVDDCIETQKDFCLDIAPRNYSVAHAQECLNAVKAAYEDAKLSAADIAVVIKLAKPCDQLSTGTSDEGESCAKHDDCNTAGGLTCVIKGAATAGTCEKPEVVGGGKSCDDAEQTCEEDFFCNGENCVEYSETGDTCAGDFECQPSARCLASPTDETVKTCEARLPRSEACTADNDCQSLYCAKAQDETEGLCADTVILSQREPLCAALR